MDSLLFFSVGSVLHINLAFCVFVFIVLFVFVLCHMPHVAYVSGLFIFDAPPPLPPFGFL